MKKSCVVLFFVCILLISSVSFAGGYAEVIVNGADTRKTFSAVGDLTIDSQAACSYEGEVTSCTGAKSFSSGSTTKLELKIWAPTAVGYTWYLFISDFSGTVKYFVNTSISEGTAATFRTFIMTTALPNGEYLMSSVVTSADGKMAVSMPHRFEVKY